MKIISSNNIENTNTEHQMFLKKMLENQMVMIIYLSGLSIRRQN